jgi:hypothetical protein
MLLLFILSWLFSALLAFGLVNGCWRGRHPGLFRDRSLATKSARDDLCMALFFGPLMLIAAVMYLTDSPGYHGLSFRIGAEPEPKEDK